VDKHDVNDLYRAALDAADECLKQVEEYLRDCTDSVDLRVKPDPAWQAFLDDHPELTT